MLWENRGWQNWLYIGQQREWHKKLIFLKKPPLSQSQKANIQHCYFWVLLEHSSTINSILQGVLATKYEITAVYLHSLMQRQEMCCKISCACLTQTKAVFIISLLFWPVAWNPGTLIAANCTGETLKFKSENTERKTNYHTWNISLVWATNSLENPLDKN